MQTLHTPSAVPLSGKGDHYLCLNAAEGPLQVLIARRDAPGVFTSRCFASWHAPSQGAELLMRAVADALAALGLSGRDIGSVACTRGPGSFTGLRLTIATAAGLARTLAVGQAGIDSLPLLAHSACRVLAPLSSTPRTVWTLTHARRNLLHMQAFRVCLPQRMPSLCPVACTALSDILVCSPQEAALVISDSPAPEGDSPLVLGSGLTRNAAAFAAAFGEGRGKGAPLLLGPDYDHPRPEALLDFAAVCEYGRDDIEPLYVRPPDAEENLEHIARSLGLDPAEAREKLDRLLRAVEME